jgi:hypothetical protein
VNPDHDCCYISYDGEEIAKQEYDVSTCCNVSKRQNYFLIEDDIRNRLSLRNGSVQILVAPKNCDLTWVHASNGHIPTGAVQGGYNGQNHPLYIGRAQHEDCFAVGKVSAQRIFRNS